jgi:hypothetical protein
MPTADGLRAAFAAAAVAKIAILDDGYDPPALTDVNENDWLGLRTTADELSGSGDARLAALSLTDLPTFGDLRSDTVGALWRAYSQRVIDTPIEAPDALDKALDAVFRSFSGRKLEKLQQLQFVEQAAERATGSPPERLPSTTLPNRLAEFDLVFLDFFLGEEINPQTGDVSQDMLVAAQDNAARIVREAAASARPNATPLFVLISSRASNDNVPDFRDRAEQLASKLRFLTKDEIRQDALKTEFVLIALVGQRSAGNAIEQLLAEWKKAIEGASKDFLTSVRRLDVPEYAYLQHYKLAEEKVSLLEYITWLYNAYLGSLVEGRMARSPAALVAPLKPANLPAAQLQPMSEVPTIYSSVTTTQIRNFEDGADIKVWTGDLYVRRKFLGPQAANDLGPPGPGTDAAVGAVMEDGVARAPAPIPQPDILSVVSPVCDLVPGRQKAMSIALTGGRLSPLGANRRPSSNHLIVLAPSDLPPGARAPEFLIDWNSKWPVAHPIEAFDGEAIAHTDYVRVGRLRDLYAAELAHDLGADLSRVGVPKAPQFSYQLEVRALIRHKGKTRAVLESAADKGLAWEMSGKKANLVFSEEFLWALRAGVSAIVADEASEIRQIIERLDVLQTLTVPFQITDKATPTPAGKKILVRRSSARPPSLEGPGNDEVLILEVYGPVGGGGDAEPPAPQPDST